MKCLRMKGVAVRRRGKVILDVPEFALDAGQFLGIVGPNGAGKSTFLDLCAALCLPSDGRVEVLERRTGDLSAWKRSNLRCRIGYVAQSPPANCDMPFTAREVIEGGRAGIRGLVRRLGAEDRAVVNAWMERLDLLPLAGRMFRTLSGGEQRKVLIARAMTQCPDLLLLDEPTANLDMDWKERVVLLIDELYRSVPMTVVMVSHETGLLPAGCGIVGLMSGGRITALGPPRDVLTPEKLSLLFSCPVHVTICDGRRHAFSSGPPACASGG